MHGSLDASVRELAAAGSVVVRLLLGLGLRLRLKGSQSHRVIQSVLLVLSLLLSGHLVQIHGQRVVGAHIQDTRRRGHGLQRVTVLLMSVLRASRAGRR